MDELHNHLKQSPRKLRPLVGVPAILLFGAIGVMCVVGLAQTKGGTSVALLLIGVVFLGFAGGVLRELFRKPVGSSPGPQAEQVEAPAKKPKHTLRRGVIALCLLGIGFYLAYVMGFLKPVLDSVGSGGRVITSAILETQCVVESKSMTNGYTGFFDYTLTVTATVRNKTGRSLRAWVRADILSGQRVIFSRVESAMIAPNGSSPIAIQFPEAEQKDQSMYTHFIVLVDRVE